MPEKRTGKQALPSDAVEFIESSEDAVACPNAAPEDSDPSAASAALGYQLGFLAFS